MSKNYYEILGLQPGVTQKEILNAYRKMALKYHPDKNGNAEWAKEKFQEIKEAFDALMPTAVRKKFEFSNKPGSDKFKEFEEMLKEVTRNLDNIEEKLNESREALDREQERLWSEAIRNMEENLTLAGVSSSDLDSSLWSPYSDWKEKARNSFNSDLDVFLSNMRIEIAKAKVNKNSYNQSGQGNYSHDNYSWQNSQQPKRPKYGDNPPPNFSPNNHGQGGGWKPFSTEGDKVQQLEAEIEYNRNYMLKTDCEEEKAKCRKIIDRLEKELGKLKSSSNSSKNGEETPNSGNDGSSSNSGDNSTKKNERDEKINQLEAEIQNLKNQNSSTQTAEQKVETEKKLKEKERELSELGKNGDKEDNDIMEVENEEELKNKIKELKTKQKNGELTKKVSQIKKIVQQLVKEIQELETEITELKKKNNLSEYETYYLSQQESLLKDKHSKLNQLRDVIKNTSSKTSNPNKNKFPTGWVVGGGILLIVSLMIVVLIRKKKGKRKR